MGLLGGRFGTVDKAAFLIGKSQKDDGTWDFEGPAEVLINPDKLRVMATTQVKKEEGVANDSTSAGQNVDGKITPKGITEEAVEMTLLFNVVEAYNAKTEGAPLGAEVALSMVSGVDDEAEKLSVSTRKLLGLVKLGGKLIRELPGR